MPSWYIWISPALAVLCAVVCVALARRSRRAYLETARLEAEMRSMFAQDAALHAELVLLRQFRDFVASIDEATTMGEMTRRDLILMAQELRRTTAASGGVT